MCAYRQCRTFSVSLPVKRAPDIVGPSAKVEKIALLTWMEEGAARGQNMCDPIDYFVRMAVW